jgi:hypothetical protein
MKNWFHKCLLSQMGPLVCRYVAVEDAFFSVARDIKQRLTAGKEGEGGAGAGAPAIKLGKDKKSKSSYKSKCCS